MVLCINEEKISWLCIRKKERKLIEYEVKSGTNKKEMNDIV